MVFCYIIGIDQLVMHGVLMVVYLEPFISIFHFLENVLKINQVHTGLIVYQIIIYVYRSLDITR